MSFMEWWGEQIDPGEKGTIDTSATHESCSSRSLVILRLLAIVIGVPIAWHMIASETPLPAFQAYVLVVGGTLIYVALAYLVNPKPAMDNIGLLGGLVDHPGRYSDDVNFRLLVVKCLLGPGRFIAESLLDVRVLFERSSEADA